MPVIERSSFAGITQEAFEHTLCGERRGQGQITTRQSFGECDEVRDHALVLASKHLAGATEARHHFIKDEEDVALVTPGAKSLEHALRPQTHPGSALHERFDDDGGDHRLPMVCEGVQIVEITEMGDGIAVVVASPFEHGQPAQAGRSQRVSMIRAAERDQELALRLPVLFPILQSHAHGGFDGCGSVVGVEDFRQRVGREQADQLLREQRGGRIAEAEEGGVRHAIKLCLDGVVDLGMAVPVDVRPNRSVAVEILVSVLIEKPTTPALCEHHRFMLRRAPVAHGRKGVPKVGFVDFGKVQGSRFKVQEEVFKSEHDPLRFLLPP